MFHIVLTTTCQIYYITFYLNFFLFVNFFLMCYIIFIKCKINQHLNTRDTVCFYLTSTMGVTCGIFFLSCQQHKNRLEAIWHGFFHSPKSNVLLHEVQARWKIPFLHLVEPWYPNAPRHPLSQKSQPYPPIHTQNFLNSGRRVVWQDSRKLRTAQHASVRSIETRVLVDLRNRA